MCADCVRCGLDDGEREVLRETIGEDLIVRDRRCAQFRSQYVLRLRHQHSKFRPQETLPGTRPDRQRLGPSGRDSSSRFMAPAETRFSINRSC